MVDHSAEMIQERCAISTPTWFVVRERARMAALA
jgi:hypothetical protein